MKKTLTIILALLLAALLLACGSQREVPPRATTQDPNHYDMQGVVLGEGGTPLTSGKIAWSSEEDGESAGIGGDGSFTLANLPANEEVTLTVYDRAGEEITRVIYSIWAGRALAAYPCEEGRLEIDMPVATAVLYVNLACDDATTLNCTYLSQEGMQSGNVVGITPYEGAPNMPVGDGAVG